MKEHLSSLDYELLCSDILERVLDRIAENVEHAMEKSENAIMDRAADYAAEHVENMRGNYENLCYDLNRTLRRAIRNPCSDLGTLKELICEIVEESKK